MGYVIGLTLYSVMPLDVMVSRAEWHLKLAEGRIGWMPAINKEVQSEIKQVFFLIVALTLSRGEWCRLGY